MKPIESKDQLPEVGKEMTVEEYYKGILFSAYLVGQTNQRSIQNGENGRSFTDWYNENPSIQYQSFARQEVEAKDREISELKKLVDRLIHELQSY